MKHIRYFLIFILKKNKKLFFPFSLHSYHSAWTNARWVSCRNVVSPLSAPWDSTNSHRKLLLGFSCLRLHFPKSPWKQCQTTWVCSPSQLSKSSPSLLEYILSQSESSLLWNELVLCKCHVGVIFVKKLCLF